MATASIKAVLRGDIQKVWSTVTSVENYAWRTDLSRTEILNESQFIEYTKRGDPTFFSITLVKPCERWEFDMENDNMKGHWSGAFTRMGEETEVIFTENVTAKKLLMKPFVKLYLKKQQRQFISDLERALLK